MEQTLIVQFHDYKLALVDLNNFKITKILDGFIDLLFNKAKQNSLEIEGFKQRLKSLLEAENALADPNLSLADLKDIGYQFNLQVNLDLQQTPPDQEELSEYQQVRTYVANTVRPRIRQEKN